MLFPVILRIKVIKKEKYDRRSNWYNTTNFDFYIDSIFGFHYQKSVLILLMIALLKTSFTEEILFRGFIAKRLVSVLGFQKRKFTSSSYIRCNLFRAICHYYYQYCFPGFNLYSANDMSLYFCLSQ